MTEIDEIHNSSLEWGALMNIANRIADVEDRIGPWDDLTNMVISLLENHRTSSSDVLATRVYPFLMHLYFRIREFSSPAPFNRVSRASRQTPDSSNPQYRIDTPGFLISNYDFNTYQWAISLGQDDFISNTDLWIPESALSPAQVRRLGKEADNA